MLSLQFYKWCTFGLVHVFSGLFDLEQSVKTGLE